MIPCTQTSLVTVTALGVTVGLVCEGEAVRHAIHDAWSDALALEHVQPDTVLRIGHSSGCDVRGDDIESILHLVSPAVTLRVLERRAGDLVMLHAAALADVDTGATAVLIAPSGTGKTTAAIELGRRFAYLSDETSGIAPDGMMVPYPKPLSIIKAAHLKQQVSPTKLGLVTTDRPCHLAAMLVLERDPEHVGPPLISLLDNIDALALLAPQASSLGKLDRPLHRVVELINMVGGVRLVRYSEAATLEHLVRDLLDGSAA